MATLNSFISFLIYSSSLLLVLFACIPKKTQATDSNSPVCKTYNGTYLNLNSIRDLLVQQEDKIVACFIKRSTYPWNSKLYKDDTWSKRSLQVPTEQVPQPYCTKVLYPAGVCVNKNKQILDAYKLLLPKIVVSKDDDRQNANIATADRTCLQALSSRVSVGRYVGETKFINAAKTYSRLISDKNKKGIWDLLTNKTVEDQIVGRVKSKAGVVLGQIVSEFYKNTVIANTKDVEVDYLLLRLSTSQCKA